MILGFGGLVLLSVGSVLVMSVTANFTNTFSLLNTQTLQLVARMESSIQSEVDQVETALKGVARLYSEHSLDTVDDAGRRRVIVTLLRTVRAIESVTLDRADGQRLGLQRAPDGQIIPFREPVAGAAPARKPFVGSNSASPDPVWTEPTVRDNIQFYNLSMPMVRNGVVDAVLTASFGGYTINRIAVALAKDADATSFILDDAGKLIAFSGNPKLLENRVRISLADTQDAALNRYDSAEKFDDVFQPSDGAPPGIEVRQSRDDEPHFVYITKQSALFSPKPFTLGVYYKAADVMWELRRAFVSAAVGVGMLVLALIAAIIFANFLAKRLRRISSAAERFSRLDLDGFVPLPSSRVREIQSQTTSINAMHGALSAFRQYVPQSLVARLLLSGDEATRSVEREMTVMFSDIVGFTSQAEDMKAHEIVAILNEHFEIVSREIMNTGGTVDKFLGDGVMAFWGAPEADADHAKHAIDAVEHITQRIEQENAKRKTEGKPVFQLRLGVHTGRVVVGNIGGGERTNYTVIGNTVNVANRLEQMGKDLDNGSDVTAVISHAAWVAAGEPENYSPAGSHIIRGNTRPLTVLTYDGNDQNAPSNIIPLPATGA